MRSGSLVGFTFFHAEEVDAAIVERAQALWLARATLAESDPTQATLEELAQFGWWFASRKFPVDWSLEQLSRILGRGVRPELDHGVADALATIAETKPLPVLACFEKMPTAMPALPPDTLHRLPPFGSKLVAMKPPRA